MTSDYILVLTTLPASADAAAFGARLVDERLAACVNVLPAMDSVYRWQGAVERGIERQLVMKTTGDRLSALRKRIGELHPYEVPELLVVPVVDGSDAYLRWITESTRDPS